MSSFSNNKKLIMDYINGNDINVDLDILENDLEFMMAVMDFSNDKLIYNLCSEEIKYNFRLIKFLIEKFSNDLDFILDVVTNFLDNYDHTYWYKKYLEEDFEEDKINTEELEVLITIDKYLPRVLEPKVLDIKVRLKTAFIKFRSILECIIINSEDETLEQTVGKGFILIESMFPTSYLVKDYYAKEMIEEIFKNYQGNTLDERIHNIYSNGEIPTSAIKLLIDVIKRHDTELASYIIARPQSFDEITNEIIKVLKEWKKSADIYLDEKINTILDTIEDYYFKHGHRISIEEFEAIKYFANILGLEEKFKEIDPVSYECISLPISSKKDNYFDKKMINDLTPIIKGIMASKSEYDLVEEANTPNNPSNISEFKPRR